MNNVNTKKRVLKPLQSFLGGLAVVTVIVLSGCSDKESAQSNSAGLNGDGSVVLSKVNATVITEKQLELAIEKIDSLSDVFVSDDIKQDVLESLVSSRALSLSAEALFSKKEHGNTMQQQEYSQIMTEVNLRTQAYREELLIKYLIEEKGNIIPVTSSMVEKFYKDNLELFGASQSKTYELIKAEVKDKNTEVFLRNELERVAALKEWSSQARNLANQGYIVNYSKGLLQKGLLDKKLETMIDEIEGLEVATVKNIGEILYLIRVIEVKELPARPLSEVSLNIRKHLAPLQLKKTLAQLNQEVLTTTTVEYINK